MSYLIAAVDSNMGIGLNNDLPWTNTEEGKKDMKFFCKQTQNSAVLIGYSTWKSIGKLLPGRLNIIVTKSHYAEMKSIENIHNYNKTHNFDYSNDNTDVKIFDDLKLALLFALDYERTTNKHCYICGGKTIYQQYLKKFIPKKIYLTRFKNDYNCDVQFPLEEFNDFIRDNTCVKLLSNDIFHIYEHSHGGRFK